MSTLVKKEGRVGGVRLICLYEWSRLMSDSGVAGRGPETGLLYNTRKWIVRGDTCADKARAFIGKGRPGGEQWGEGTQENSSATWLTVLGFMVMGLASGLSLANHSDSESFLVVHALFSQDGCQWKGFSEVVRHEVSPFHLSWTLPVDGGLLVPCSLPGLPVLKQRKTTHAMVTMVPGYYGAWPGGAVSVSVLPLIVGRGGVWWTGEHKHHLKGRYVGTLWLTDASWEWGPSVATIPYFQDKSEMRLLMYNLTLFTCYFFLPFWPHCLAHRILVPQPRIEFVPPAAGSWSLNCWTTRELPILWFLKVYN